MSDEDDDHSATLNEQEEEEEEEEEDVEEEEDGEAFGVEGGERGEDDGDGEEQQDEDDDDDNEEVIDDDDDDDGMDDQGETMAGADDDDDDEEDEDDDNDGADGDEEERGDGDEEEDHHDGNPVSRKMADTGTGAAKSKKSSSNKTDPALLGGALDKPAFCLLEGINHDEWIRSAASHPANDGGGDDDDDDNMNNIMPSMTAQDRVRVAIDRLPATLGRDHKTTDETFLGMGPAKALSRQQCRIEYRTTQGSLQYVSTTGKFRYQPNASALPILNPFRISHSADKPPKKLSLPETGFFTITSMGKNRIFVNGTRLDQGQTAILRPGSAIRISTYCLYFLLPLQKQQQKQAGRSAGTVMYVPDNRATTTGSTSAGSKANRHAVPSEIKSSSIAGGGTASAGISTTATTLHNVKKRTPSMVGSSAPAMIKRPKAAASVVATANAAAAAAAAAAAQQAIAAGSASGGPSHATVSVQQELDSLPTEELRRLLTVAIENDVWDRRHQLIGSTVSYRAVLEAAENPMIRQMADENGGIARGQVVQWISEHPDYTVWVEQMLTKLEPKSYQASITKAMIRAQYNRTAGSGRYIKWILPDGTGSKKYTAGSIITYPSSAHHGGGNSNSRGTPALAAATTTATTGPSPGKSLARYKEAVAAKKSGSSSNNKGKATSTSTSTGKGMKREDSGSEEDNDSSDDGVANDQQGSEQDDDDDEEEENEDANGSENDDDDEEQEGVEEPTAGSGGDDDDDDDDQVDDEEEESRADVSVAETSPANSELD